MRNDFLSTPRLLSGFIVTSAAITFVALFLAAPTRAAGPPPLSGPEISKLISGTTVHLHTPVGGVLPVLYRHNGTLTGRAGTMLSFYLGASRDEGKWWISGSKLCQQWNVWFKGKKNCLDIRRKGADFHWNDGKGESGLATIVARSKKTVVASRKKPKKRKKHVRIGPPTGLGAPFPIPSRKPKVPAVTESNTPTSDAVVVADKPANKKPAVKKAVAANAKPRQVERKTRTTVAALAPPRHVALSPVRAATPGWSAGSAKTPQQRWAERQKALRAELKKLADLRVKERAQNAQENVPPRSTRAGFVTAKNNAATATPRFRVAGVASWDVLNMRAEPDVAGAIVTTIPSDATGVEMAGACSRDWCRVKYANRHGWVHQKYLEREAPRVAVQKRFRVVGVYDGDVLNIRRQPSASAPVSGAIAPNADDVAITGACRGEWCPVAHRQHRGWVHRYYIELNAKTIR
ncbi:MAG: SH3 domain-containing protein [Hyphomicrobiaceae bacterium]